MKNILINVSNVVKVHVNVKIENIIIDIRYLFYLTTQINSGSFITF